MITTILGSMICHLETPFQKLNSMSLHRRTQARKVNTDHTWRHQTKNINVVITLVIALPMYEQSVPKFMCVQVENYPLISPHKSHTERKECSYHITTDVNVQKHIQSSVPESVLSLFGRIPATKHTFERYCTSFNVPLQQSISQFHKNTDIASLTVILFS
jgi:hypothetical protein